jgi:hypothetical protein
MLLDICPPWQHLLAQLSSRSFVCLVGYTCQSQNARPVCTVVRSPGAVLPGPDGPYGCIPFCSCAVNVRSCACTLALAHQRLCRWSCVHMCM